MARFLGSIQPIIDHSLVPLEALNSQIEEIEGEIEDQSHRLEAFKNGIQNCLQGL
jgi:hypothetical protein